jgi:hypothetical protein
MSNQTWILFSAAIAAAALVAWWESRDGKSRYRVELTREQVAAIIESFVNRTAGTWDWDDFFTFPIADPRLNEIRERCISLSEEFPPNNEGEYCGPPGVEVMRAFIRELRSEQSP